MASSEQRIPLAASISSRNSTGDRDALLTNAIVVKDGDKVWVEKRPGYAVFADGPTANSQNIFAIGDQLYQFSNGLARIGQGSRAVCTFTTGAGSLPENVDLPTNASYVGFASNTNTTWCFVDRGTEEYDLFSTTTLSGTWTQVLNNEQIGAGGDEGAPLNNVQNFYYQNGALWIFESAPTDISNPVRPFRYSRSTDGGESWITFIATSTDNVFTGVQDVSIFPYGNDFVIAGGTNSLEDEEDTDRRVFYLDVSANTIEYRGRTNNLVHRGRGIRYGKDIYLLDVGFNETNSFIEKSEDGGFTWKTVAAVNANEGSVTPLILDNKIYNLAENSSNGVTWNGNGCGVIAGEPSDWALAHNGIPIKLGVAGASTTVLQPTFTFPSTTTWPSSSSSSQLYFAAYDQTAPSGARGFIMKTGTAAWYFDVEFNTITQITSVNYPTTTVPGAVILNGRVYVMNDKAQIFASGLYTPLTWSALDVIGAIQDSDKGVAITKYRNYIVVFKEFTTEFFYDAGASPGIPIRRVDSAFTEIGCVSGDSVVSFNNTVFWIGASKRVKGRAVYKFDGYLPVKISDSFVERVLEADDLSNIRAFAFQFRGKNYYGLTLLSTRKTVVLDIDLGIWSEWTGLSMETSLSLLNNSWEVTTDGVEYFLTITSTETTAKELPKPGELVRIENINSVTYLNNDYYVHASTNNGFIVKLGVDYLTPEITDGSNATVRRFISGVYPLVSFCGVGDKQIMQHLTDGSLYQILPFATDDATLPIDWKIRTSRIDFNTMKTKVCDRVEFVGDRGFSILALRYSDDDYDSNAVYRFVNLNEKRPQFTRLGSFRRRSFELRTVDTHTIRAEALEVEIRPNGKT